MNYGIINEEQGGRFSFSKCVEWIRPNEDLEFPLNFRDIKKNIQFILDHFPKPLFPRTVSTQITDNRQIIVNDINQVYQKFNESKFTDCRISAFPATEKPIPNFLFIDLDNDKTNVTLTSILKRTLLNIRQKLGGTPTVLWTGNGYHIYQPIECRVRLCELQDFKDFENIDNKFLRFAKDSLSNGGADKKNYVALKSCLLRIPGSVNSKNLKKGQSIEDSMVRIIQKWDEYRPSIMNQLGSFHLHFVTQMLKDHEKLRRLEQLSMKSYPRKIKWIETLLQIPLSDSRKFCIWRILIPYLVNIRKLKNYQSFEIIKKWSQKCDKIRKIDFDICYRINTGLRYAYKYLPISLENLERENPYLYSIIMDHLNVR